MKGSFVEEMEKCEKNEKEFQNCFRSPLSRLSYEQSVCLALFWALVLWNNNNKRDPNYNPSQTGDRQPRSRYSVPIVFIHCFLYFFYFFHSFSLSTFRSYFSFIFSSPCQIPDGNNEIILAV